MLNKELYAKELVELALSDDSVAVTHNGVTACMKISCDDCLFRHATCEKEKIAWGNEEALIEPELTKVQKLYNNLSDEMKDAIINMMTVVQSQG